MLTCDSPEFPLLATVVAPSPALGFIRSDVRGDSGLHSTGGSLGQLTASAIPPIVTFDDVEHSRR
jgi:hypothetical protein